MVAWRGWWISVHRSSIDSAWQSETQAFTTEERSLEKESDRLALHVCERNLHDRRSDRRRWAAIDCFFFFVPRRDIGSLSFVLRTSLSEPSIRLVIDQHCRSSLFTTTTTTSNIEIHSDSANLLFWIERRSKEKFTPMLDNSHERSNDVDIFVSVDRSTILDSHLSLRSTQLSDWMSTFVRWWTANGHGELSCCTRSDLCSEHL